MEINMKEYSILLEETPLTEKMIEGVLDRIIEQIDDVEKILLVPPDITRCYSGGGQITAYLYWKLSKRTEVFIMPAVGTHRAMTRDEQKNFLILQYRKKRSFIMIGKVIR